MSRRSRRLNGEPDESSDDNAERIRSGPKRRTFLRASAGAAIATAGLGAVGSTVASDEYDVVLDIVEDLGADDTGDDPINEALAEAVDNHDSVKVLFPDGEYAIHEGEGGDGFARWDFGDGDEGERVGDVALVGDGDATLRPTHEGDEDGRHNILTLWGRKLEIENFRVDQTPHDVSTGITAVAEDELLVRDVLYDGKVTGDYFETPPPGEGYAAFEELTPDDPFCLVPGLLHEGGEGVIEDVRAPDGVESLSRKGGVWVNFLHAGDLLFRRCEFSNFSDNALYGSPPGASHGEGGSVRVENCLFENNNVTAIRLGTPGSYAKNCTVVTEAGEIPATPWGAITSRAGWVWYSFDGFYKNIDVIHDHPDGEGILDHGDETRDVELAVRNSRFELNNDGSNAVRVSDPEVERLAVENVSVTGDAGDDAALDIGNCAVAIEGLCVTQTGDDRDGIHLTSATGSISDVDIDVTGEQIVTDEESTVSVTNLSDDGNCQTVTANHPLE